MANVRGFRFIFFRQPLVISRARRRGTAGRARFPLKARSALLSGNLEARTPGALAGFIAPRPGQSRRAQHEAAAAGWKGRRLLQGQRAWGHRSHWLRLQMAEADGTNYEKTPYCRIIVTSNIAEVIGRLRYYRHLSSFFN